MKKLLLTLLCVVGLYSNVFGQCDFTTKIKYHTYFMDVVDSSKYWFNGVQFTAYDLDGNLIGRSPIPSPSIAVRSGYFPLHVYGDDFTTDSIEGPINGDQLFVNSNLIKGCGRLKTDRPIIFVNWLNFVASFQHPGDINNDKKIDMVDYKAVQKAVSLSKYFGIYDCKADVNNDGTVNATDGGLVGRIVLYNDPKSTIGKWGYACN